MTATSAAPSIDDVVAGIVTADIAEHGIGRPAKIQAPPPWRPVLVPEEPPWTLPPEQPRPVTYTGIPPATSAPPPAPDTAAPPAAAETVPAAASLQDGPAPSGPNWRLLIAVGAAIAVVAAAAVTAGALLHGPATQRAGNVPGSIGGVATPSNAGGVQSPTAGSGVLTPTPAGGVASPSSGTGVSTPSASSGTAPPPTQSSGGVPTPTPPPPTPTPYAQSSSTWTVTFTGGGCPPPPPPSGSGTLVIQAANGSITITWQGNSLGVPPNHVDQGAIQTNGTFSATGAAPNDQFNGQLSGHTMTGQYRVMTGSCIQTYTAQGSY